MQACELLINVLLLLIFNISGPRSGTTGWQLTITCSSWLSGTERVARAQNTNLCACKSNMGTCDPQTFLQHQMWPAERSIYWRCANFIWVLLTLDLYSRIWNERVQPRKIPYFHGILLKYPNWRFHGINFQLKSYVVHTPRVLNWKYHIIFTPEFGTE